MANRVNAPPVNDWEDVNDWAPAVQTPTLDQRNLSTLDVKAGKGVVTPDQIKFNPPKQVNGGFWGGLGNRLVAPFKQAWEDIKEPWNNIPLLPMMSAPNVGDVRKMISQGGVGKPQVDKALGVLSLPTQVRDVAEESSRRGAANESTSDMYGDLTGTALQQALLVKGVPGAIGAVKNNLMSPKVLNSAFGEGAINKLTGANAGRAIAREGITGNSPEILHTQIKSAIPRWQETVDNMLQSIDGTNRSISGPELLTKAFPEPPLNVSKDAWNDFRTRIKVRMDKVSPSGMLTPAEVHELKNSILPEYERLTGSVTELSANRKAADVRRLFDHTVDSKVPGYEQVNDHLSDLHHADEFLQGKIWEGQTQRGLLEQPIRAAKILNPTQWGVSTDQAGIKTGMIPLGMRTKMASMGTDQFIPKFPEFEAEPIPGLSEPSYSDLSGDPMVPGRSAAIPAGPTGGVYNDPGMSAMIGRSGDLASMARGGIESAPPGNPTRINTPPSMMGYENMPPVEGNVSPEIADFARTKALNAKYPPPTTKVLPAKSSGPITPPAGQLDADTPNNPSFWRGREGVVPKGVEPSGTRNVPKKVASPADIETLVSKAGNAQAQARTAPARSTWQDRALNASKETVTRNNKAISELPKSNEPLTKEEAIVRSEANKKVAASSKIPTVKVSDLPDTRAIAAAKEAAGKAAKSDVQPYTDLGEHKVGDTVHARDSAGREFRNVKIVRAFPSKHGPAVAVSTPTGERFILAKDLKAAGSRREVAAPKAPKVVSHPITDEASAWKAAEGKSAIKTPDGKINTGMDHREIRQRLKMPTEPKSDMPTAGIDPENSGWYINGKFVSLQDMQASSGSLAEAYNKKK